MAQKKKNIYSGTQMEVLKRELLGVIEYLENLNVNNITDRVGWKIGAKGPIPNIISSQEKIIATVVGEIRRSANIIIAVFDAEGMNEILGYQVKTTIDKLKELQDFYFNQNINSITDRYLEMPIGKNKDGSTKILKLVAASEEDQRSARGRITEAVTKLIPLIDVIKNYKVSTVRGGVEATPAMLRFEKRKATQKSGEDNE